jgi:hypothetical protein
MDQEAGPAIDHVLPNAEVWLRHRRWNGVSGRTGRGWQSVAEGCAPSRQSVGAKVDAMRVADAVMRVLLWGGKWCDVKW